MGHLNSQLAHRTARPFEAAHKAKGAVDESGLPRVWRQVSVMAARQPIMHHATLHRPPALRDTIRLPGNLSRQSKPRHVEGCGNPTIRFAPM